MARHASQSLFAKIETQEQGAKASWGAFVPVDDFAIYATLVREMAEAVATTADRSTLALIVDAATRDEVEAVDAARSAAHQVFHFGETIPQAWAVARNIVPCEANADVSPDDRFFVALSSSLSLAILGSKGVGGPGDGFRGGWTGQRGIVERIAETILSSNGYADRLAQLGPGLPEQAEQVYACSVRLMAHMARQLSSRQQDIARDKDDLFSVLNILKAISAKRRAHDILYVFVEQIARVVDVKRCSVVRVWGGDDKGHVLASHEDVSVRDLVIDLAKYPELQHALKTRNKVVVNDACETPLTKPFAGELKKSGITSLLVIPVVLFDQNVGSLFLRGVRGTGPFSLREIGFCEIVAEAAANALERANLFETIQRANQRLELLAITDGLTGLYNHRYFRERLEEEFERAQRYSLPLSCLIFDVDDFKAVNDTYGHLQGDAVLREIADRAGKMVRKSDMVARYGGEEFVVIMPQTKLDGARVEAERIRKDIENRPYEGLPPDRHITVSVGVAVFNSTAMSDCEALIRAADEALYKAKRAGKNCVVTEGSDSE